MKLAIPGERHGDEPRVAASPETIKKFIALGLSAAVESGAGTTAGFADDLYRDAGAEVGAGVLTGADIILKVRPPEGDDLKAMKSGAVLVALLEPHAGRERLTAWAQAGISAFAMELMPRITRAQSMDVLSSQANLAGYRAVVDATALFGRAMPMMMTAAGTIAPARVFVMGAGVAGLQAIATARRMGAIVSATDVRAAVREQVMSLGADFVMAETQSGDDTGSGYATELSDDDKKRQAELVAGHLRKQDIVITTALIPGRPAPRLITQEMVESMKPGSLIVDMAVEQGGNCALSQPGETVTHGGVTIAGWRNIPGRIAADSSALYARNLFNFVSLMIADGALAIDMEDEIIAATLLTRDGAVVHPDFAAN